MINIYVYVTRPLRASCRKLVYLAGEVASSYPDKVKLVMNEKDESEITEQERPRPYLQVDDYIMGKNVTLHKIEEIVIKKLNKDI